MEVKKETTNIIYSKDPYVSTYDNIITDEECKHFIDISKESLKRSLVSYGKEGKISSGRTGFNTWIKHDHDEITKNIGERIAKIVNIPLERAESFQVIYYGVTQEYRPHYDSWEHNGSEKTLRCMKYGGARIKTALCYLNDVKKGGGTKMTKLNITVKPKKGRLLIFDNTIKETNIRHPLSEHAGLPVEEGEKYAFNLWFKECNSKMLYSEFNPEYYKKEESKIPLIESDDISFKNNKKKFKIENGDFIPFLKIKGITRIKHIHNYSNCKPFYFITINDIKNIIEYDLILNKLTSEINIIIIGKKNTIKNSKLSSNILYTLDEQLNKIFEIGDEIKVYIANPNRRIIHITTINDILHPTFDISKYKINNIHIPYLIIENALSKELLEKVINFYNNKKKYNSLIKHCHSTKNRLHVHPDSELEKELDNKISRSILPEIKKVLYFDIKHRETYKICSYDAETSGRFHAHRDTPAPYQHRKYAMTLFLNDDYEGGEFHLLEYGLKIKPKANTAFIFPGICTHKVLEVTKGSRMVIITFFVNGETRPQYKMKSHFYDDKGIVESEIYPL